MTDFEVSLLHPDATVYEALARIEASEGKIAIVTDPERRLIGTVTDGDVRRALLRGMGLETPVREVMNSTPVHVHPETSAEEVLAIMRSRVLRHVPVIDGEGRVLEVRTLQELLEPQLYENWVVILAGGRGTRLRPLTRETPKSMLEVGGRPILESTIVRCASAGFRRLFLSVNYQADVIRDHFGDGERHGVRIEYLEENEPLGTAGPLGLLPSRPEKPVLVMNGDILTNLNLGRLVEFHCEHGAHATMGVRQYEMQIPYGVVTVEENAVLGFHEKPYQQHYVNAGLYVLEPDVIGRIPRGHACDMPEIFERAMSAGLKVLAFPIREYWLDIGHVDDYVRANLEYPKVF